MSKILITGAHGQLGTELCHLLDEKGIAYDAFGSKELDITNQEQVKAKLAELKPAVVFHCAAYTAVDKAEDEDKKLNWQVNEDGTKNVAEAAQTIGATLVYISTDYVFDGTNEGEYQVDASTNPKNEYGKAKLAGEEAVKSIMDQYYIIRTSWVFGEYGKNFVYTMLRLAKTHDHLTVVDDQVGRPTWTRTLAEFMLYAIEHQIPYGTYQLSNDGSCTWYEFAREILKNEKVEVSPVTSAEYPQKAYRPRHSIMSLDKVKETGFEVPSWQEALENFSYNYNQFVSDILKEFVPQMITKLTNNGIINDKLPKQEKIKKLKEYFKKNKIQINAILDYSEDIKNEAIKNREKEKYIVGIILLRTYIEHKINGFYSDILTYNYRMNYENINNILRSNISAKVGWLFELTTNNKFNDKLKKRIKYINELRNEVVHYHPRPEDIDNMSNNESLIRSIKVQLSNIEKFTEEFDSYLEKIKIEIVKGYMNSDDLSDFIK